jgi:hypothetical protein
MKLIGKSALVVMLGVLVLASAASAGYVSSVGGAVSHSTNGGGLGTATGTLTYDTSHSLLQPLNGLTTGTLSDVLTEVIVADANVPTGSIGDASASFTTNGAQTFTQPLTVGVAPATYNPGSYISTTVNGVVSASVTKTSVLGDATAHAQMQAQSATNNLVANLVKPSIGGTASLVATASMTQGLGVVLAEAKGTASHVSSLGNEPVVAGGYTGVLGYSTGSASGDAKVSGSNSADTASGIISGTSTNYAGTFYDSATRKGEGIDYEHIIINANRGPSFDGDSEMAAYLNDGAEAGETNTEVVTLGVLSKPVIIDNEAHSVMNANASAYSAWDFGTANLNVLSETGTDGQEATADSNLYATSTVNRDLDHSTKKAVGQGFIPSASWIASTTMESPAVPLAVPAVPAYSKFAMVSGSTGVVQDGMGNPSSLTGVGVGSWIVKPALSAQTATAYQMQLATSDLVVVGHNPATQIVDSKFLVGGLDADPSMSTDAIALDTAVKAAPAVGVVAQDQEMYKVLLTGRPVTGVTNDAVGAYLGVANQKLDTFDASQTLPLTHDFALNVPSRNGIEWLEGNNPSLIPGHYSVNLMPTNLGVTATSRTSGLTDILKGS